MKVIGQAEILAALDEARTLEAVAEGFRRLSAGDAQLMAVGHLAFADPPGDCHVKGGYLDGDEVFVVKLATSFYRNPQAGLESSNGFMAVVSARTGEVLALLHDRGRLTDIRTAMAGAVAGRAIQRPGSRVLGVVGTGTQARLQADLLARTLGYGTTLVWGRDAGRTQAMAAKLGARSAPLDELCAQADLIVTTTPSTEPILTLDMVRPNARIVAVGADAPGKRELDVALVARARIVADSIQQCVDHGETGWAVRAGLVDPAGVMELGRLLAQPAAFADDEMVIADLTGVGVQDVQIAKAVWDALKG